MDRSIICIHVIPYSKSVGGDQMLSSVLGKTWQSALDALGALTETMLQREWMIGSASK